MVRAICVSQSSQIERFYINLYIKPSTNLNQIVHDNQENDYNHENDECGDICLHYFGSNSINRLLN